MYTVSSPSHPLTEVLPALHLAFSCVTHIFFRFGDMEGYCTASCFLTLHLAQASFAFSFMGNLLLKLALLFPCSLLCVLCLMHSHHALFLITLPKLHGYINHLVGNLGHFLNFLVAFKPLLIS